MPTHEDAWKLLCEYTASESLRKHMLAVEACVRAYARKAGANEEIRYAVVGFNERGRSHIEGMRKVKGTRLIALCDVDRSVLGVLGPTLRDKEDKRQNRALRNWRHRRMARAG